MAERQMLPAIYFIFSRRGCDKAVRDLGVQCLVNQEEQVRIKERLTAYSHDNPEAVRDGIHADALLRGISAHHAGVLPAWKELIEELFQQGLVKVVFATETLAAGINMPARSTVIAALSKRTERGHRPLMGSEFLQMAGRAGRRGLDPVGTVIIAAWENFPTESQTRALLTGRATKLESQFRLTYGMILNLMRVEDLRVEDMLARSFCLLYTSPSPRD